MITNGTITNSGINAFAAIDYTKVAPSASNGQILKSNGTAWTCASDSIGDLVGPASSTDNSVVRYDGTTGKFAQDSSVTILDNGNVGIGTTVPSTSLHVNGTVTAISFSMGYQRL